MSYGNVHTENEALAKAVTECAWSGRPHTITNSDLNVVWSIEPDTKVDIDDLSFPVIVHMRGGAIPTDGLAILIPGTHKGRDY